MDEWSNQHSLLQREWSIKLGTKVEYHSATTFYKKLASLLSSKW